MKQKDVFLESEGNAWLERNTGDAATAIAESDPLLVEILNLRPPPGRASKVLEIGCADGARLQRLAETFGCACYGLEPSAHAVEVARARGIEACQGTAEQLPYADQSFEMVMFGFCLYLCDREDLFRIACEADRVLQSPGWLLIHDFYSPAPSKREYHHRAGLFSHKMDYRTLFTWHPAYVTYSHRVRDHAHGGYTDAAQEWVATSVLRKQSDRQ
jgi:ubiquinone/menaquinone biosynthesis C-methylase UbiE